MLIHYVRLTVSNSAYKSLNLSTQHTDRLSSRFQVQCMRNSVTNLYLSLHDYHHGRSDHAPHDVMSLDMRLKLNQVSPTRSFAPISRTHPSLGVKIRVMPETDPLLPFIRD
jgi:hypothetical protein